MIELPIFFHSETTSMLDDLGVEVNLSDCEVRNITFLKITHVCPYEDNYTKVCIGEDQFISPLDYEIVKNKLRESFQH